MGEYVVAFLYEPQPEKVGVLFLLERRVPRKAGRFVGINPISAILLYNCSKKEDESEILTSSFFNNDFGAVANRDFMGQVLDIQGSPISGVNITVGTSTKTTDGRGFFIINDAPVKERFAIVKANKAGYLEGSRSVIPLTGMNNLKLYC